MKLKNRKILTILLSTIVLSTLSLSFAFAELNTDWPTSPAGTNISEGADLTVLIQYLYEWGIALGGIAVFVMLIFAGIQYMTSSGNPTKMQEALQKIRSSALGLVLLLGSWLILNTINPELTSLNMPELPDVGRGVNFNLAISSDLPECSRIELQDTNNNIETIQPVEKQTLQVLTATDLANPGTYVGALSGTNYVLTPVKINFFRKKTEQECLNYEAYNECLKFCDAGDDTCNNNCWKSNRDLSCEDEEIEGPGQCYVEILGYADWWGTIAGEECGDKIGTIANTTDDIESYLTQEKDLSDIRCINIVVPKIP